MANSKEEQYADARMNLDSAMADFIMRGRDAGFSDQSIADSVLDSIYDASGQTIKVSSDLIE